MLDSPATTSSSPFLGACGVVVVDMVFPLQCLNRPLYPIPSTHFQRPPRPVLLSFQPGPQMCHSELSRGTPIPATTCMEPLPRKAQAHVEAGDPPATNYQRSGKKAHPEAAAAEGS